MANYRALALRDYFRENGLVAGMPGNYKYYLNKIEEVVGGRMGKPAKSAKECMNDLCTYEHPLFVGGTVICTIPAMTDEGYFIIQGSEKAVVIQEVRLKTEMFVTHECCELSLEGAYVPVRIKMTENSVMELDTHMIHRNMRGIKSVGVYELLTCLFASDVGSVSSLMRSYCGDHADACMVYVLSSMKGTGGLAIDEDRETIRYKMFGSMDNHRVVATLVTMVAACVQVYLKVIPPSDRDHYSYKCLKTPGETVYKMFKYCFASCKNPKNLRNLVENHVHTFIKRGDITIGGKTYRKVAIQLSRRSTIDALSCVRKVIVPCDENSPNLQMRQIHSSQMGFICPCETPEGKTVGITKSLACCCTVSTRTDISEWVRQYCNNALTKDDCIWVVADGAVLGWCNQDNMKHIKMSYPTVSVTFGAGIAKVRTTGGRPLRPLLVVDGHPVDWKDLRKELLDPAECDAKKIASLGYDGSWRNFTHMEVHPCTMLGLAASLVPFPEHNQSARNVFSSSMIKQAMQMGGADKVCDTLQKPLVYTEVGRAVGYDENPNGINLVTCIMSINGFNQEDAIIVKKSAIERGVFSSVVRKTTSATVDNPWTQVGTQGGLSMLHGGTERLLTEVTTMLQGSSVQNVKELMTENGRSKVHVTMEVHRELQLGDKLASRHAQKGVVGLVMSEEDMPFNEDGITPDIIINPHAIPSRMTVGQLIEGVLGKSSAINGTFADGTPFVERDINELTKMSDTETLILGTTGEMVETPVAMGIVYYMALRHQAADKVYVRSFGPKSIMSRQPISGRSKGGGLRFGEMEYDCLIAHGGSKLITDVSESSDMVDVPYCKQCNIVTDMFEGHCKLCETAIVRKRVPFSYVVLKDLMLAANIQIQTEL